MAHPITRRPPALPRASLLACAILLLLSCSHAPDPAEPIRAPRVLGGLGDTPGRFAYPRCLEASPSTSTLWVIDRSARVQRIDPLTGRCLGFFHTPEYDLGKPCGFSIAPGPDEHGSWCDELLYIADTHYHRILIYRPPPPITDDRAPREITPTQIAAFGSFGRDPAQFIYPTDTAVLVSPTPRHVDRIYVSEYGGNDRVSIFDGSFKFLFSFGSFGNSPDPSDIQFNRPQSLAIDRSRTPPHLIVADSCNHRVGVFSLDGKLIRWIGVRRATEDGSASSVSPASQTPTSSEQYVGATPPATIGAPAKFLYPYGLHVLADGTALVSEFGAARVQQIDLDTGTCLASWGRPGRHEGELAAPWAITSLNDTAYVLDSGNCRILAFPAPTKRAP